MAWYKTGTINVTNGQTTVTGTDTKFATNARVGDGFNGPDGNWYEVTNIASETVIAIFPAYQGATIASSANYMIAPLQGYNKESADRLRAITDSLTVVTSVAGKTGNVVVDKYDVGLPNVDNTSDINKPINTATQTALNGKKNNFTVLPIAEGGTNATTASQALDNLGFSPFGKTLIDDADAASGRATLVAAKSGANNDIISLSGLTTALSVSQGGTGGNTQATARSGLGLGSAAAADIVGLMSSGAIIETGSSATGTWTKFADGTMITQHRGTLGVNITTPYGALFYGVQSALALPQTFVGDLPKLLLSVSGGPVAALWIGRQSVVTAASTGAFIVIAPSSLPNATMTIDIVAIGRWKI